MELNGTHQLLVHADINLLGNSINTIKDNTETLLGASRNTSLDKCREDNAYDYVLSSKPSTEPEYKVS
jgi:hypothetical protein